MSEAPKEEPSKEWYSERSSREERLTRLGTRAKEGLERVNNTGPWLTSAELAGCLSGELVGYVIPEKPPK